MIRVSGELHELRNIIARLDLMSHAPSVNLEGGSPSSEDRGGQRPPGGISRRDDKAPDFALKSGDHFRRRLANARSERAVTMILADARKSLDGWTHSPPPADPERGSYHWKLQIVRDVQSGRMSIDRAKQHYTVGKATIYRYVKRYGDHDQLAA